MPGRSAVTRLPVSDTLTFDACRLLVDSVVDYAIFMLDTQGRVSTWNRGAERIKGYSAPEILGRHFSVFYPEEDVKAGKCEMELEVASRDGRFEDEGWRVRKDGSFFWANVVITALRGASGELVGFAKVTRDLTDRRNAERLALELEREQMARAASEQAQAIVRESEERYRELNERLTIILEGVADGITVQDAEGRVVYANHTAARLCGFDSPEELLGAAGPELVDRFEIHDEHGAPIDPAQLPGRRVLAGERPPPTLLQVRSKRTNLTWWALLRASAVTRDGVPTLAVNIWHDVTAEQREQAALRFLARASGILGASLDLEETLQELAGAVVPDLADWCTIELREGENLRRVAMAHADPEKLQAGRDQSTRLRPESQRDAGVWNVIRTGTPELHARLDDAKLVATARDEAHLAALRASGLHSAMVVPLTGRHGIAGAMAFARTETPDPFDRDDLALAEELGRRAATAIEHARLFADAQESARRAEEASRVKDEFLATVSHELRTPLNAIVGWATLLRQEATSGRLARAIEVIYRNAHAQGRIIDDILDIARIISGKLKISPQPSDLVQIARDAVDVVRPAAEARRIRLELTADPTEIPLLVDPDRIQQVIWNLLSNAIKFTEPEGSVTLALSQIGSDVHVRVTDTGRGIEPAFLPYVFERFRQADSSTTREHAGLGLGLAIVRHIVELHGGRVAATSAGRGQGATFEAVLPIRAVASKLEPAPTSAGTRSERTSLAPADVKGLRVLVVDDDADAREVLEALLSSAGVDVRTVGSVAEALEVTASFQPRVLVSDIGMPHEDGYALIRKLRARGDDLPAIALTAYTRRDDRDRALAAGFTAHVAKPVTPQDLLVTIARLALTKASDDRRS